MHARFPFLATLLLPLLLLSGCGQSGALYIPPTCSPVFEDGRISERRDEQGNVLPPCPPGEEDEETPYTEETDETLEDDFND